MLSELRFLGAFDGFSDFGFDEIWQRSGIKSKSTTNQRLHEGLLAGYVAEVPSGRRAKYHVTSAGVERCEEIRSQLTRLGSNRYMPPAQTESIICLGQSDLRELGFPSFYTGITVAQEGTYKPLTPEEAKRMVAEGLIPKAALVDVSTLKHIRIGLH